MSEAHRHNALWPVGGAPMPRTPEIASQVLLRASTAADVPFIKTTWLKSFRHASPDGPAKPVGDVYWREQSALVDRLLARAPALLAVDPEDPSLIMAWAHGEHRAGVGLLHYAFEKPLYAGFGLLPLLLDALRLESGFFTHADRQMVPLARARRLLFNPYALHGA